MILGKDVIILNSSNTAAVAAAKSCEINVQVDMIEVASPDIGVWKKYIAGHKSWSLTINYLVLSMARIIPTVGTTMNVKLAIDARNGLPFNGFVNNVTIAQGSYLGTPSLIYWDKTRKIFVGYVIPAQGVTLYFARWTDNGKYSSPNPFDVFTYKNISYTWLDNDLVKESLSGSVIVQTTKVTATVGNLVQGSFVFIGNSELTGDSLT